MTKQLSDLFEQFSTLETSAQLEKIRQIRHHRSIERPAAAVKRVKKEKKAVEKKKSNLAGLLNKLPAEQRAAIIAKLQADLNAKKGTETQGVREPDEQRTGDVDSGISDGAPQTTTGGSS